MQLLQNTVDAALAERGRFLDAELVDRVRSLGTATRSGVSNEKAARAHGLQVFPPNLLNIFRRAKPTQSAEVRIDAGA